jgi:ribosomal protein L12E/L44/L45/RPP1/RPP2
MPPEGWLMVPKELPQQTALAMCDAIEFVGAAHYLDGKKSLMDIVKAAHDAFMAAAPSAPQEQSKGAAAQEKNNG